MVWENIVSLLDYLVIVRDLLFVHTFMTELSLSSCLHLTLTSFTLLPILIHHTTAPTEPWRRSAGSQDWGHHSYSQIGEYCFEWDTVVTPLPSVGLSCIVWLRLSWVSSMTLCMNYIQRRWLGRTSDLHELSPFFKTQTDVPSSHPLLSSLHRSLPWENLFLTI